ncbi:MAG: hypothetical protein ACP5O7_00785 [Phycisphaerae bacterium]
MLLTLFLQQKHWVFGYFLFKTLLTGDGRRGILLGSNRVAADLPLVAAGVVLVFAGAGKRGMALRSARPAT